jgi:serine/threonine-protein kinase
VDSLEPEGIVAAQSPAGGTTVDLGIAVKIEVSSGKPPKTEVPGTIGMGAGVAQATLEDAGFVVKVDYEQVEDGSKVGKVIRQDPPGGTPAAEGSTVTIVVGR